MISLIKMRRARRSNKRGFTLLELVFVAAILIIVTALAVPRFGKTFDLIRLQNFVNDTISFARYAQAKAVTDGKIYRLAFDLEKKALRIDSSIGTEEESWNTEKSKSIPEYVKVEFEGDKSDIKFYPDGTADKATVEVAVSSGKSYTISVEPVTAYVRSEETKEE